jgi:hypothetical protein
MQKLNHYGNCFYNNRHCLIVIPKNASTAITTFATWTKGDYTTINRNRYIAIIRDPIDRWISGTTEYLWRLKHIHGSDEKVNLSQIVFDRHTIPQIRFLEGIDLKRTLFYKFDNTVLDRLHQDFDCFRKTANVRIINQIDTNPDKAKIKAYVKQQVIELEGKIKETYTLDYQLTNSVDML